MTIKAGIKPTGTQAAVDVAFDWAEHAGRRLNEGALLMDAVVVLLASSSRM